MMIHKLNKLHFRRIIIAATIIQAIVCFVGVFYKYPHIDEGLLAENAYHLIESGEVRSELYTGVEDGRDVRHYHFHKFYIYCGAVVYKMFGLHIETFRLINFIVYLLFVWVLYYFIRQINVPTIYFWLVQLILLWNHTFFINAFIYRPELMVMFFGFISFYFIICWKDRRKWNYLLLSGFFAGMATVTHLNGLIFVFAGTFWLLINKKLVPGIFFGAIGGLSSLLYFIDTNTMAELIAWKEQFFFDPVLVDKKPLPFMQILNEHLRFFHAESESVFSVLLIFILIFSFRKIRQQFNGILLYLGLLILGLAAITHGYTTKYMLLYFPFFALIVAYSVVNFNAYKKVQRIIIAFLLMCFIGYHGYRNFLIVSNPVRIAKQNAELLSYIPQKDQTIFGPSYLIFNNLPEHTFHGKIGYNHYFQKHKPGYRPNMYDFMTFMVKYNNKYIVMAPKEFNDLVHKEIPHGSLKPGDNYMGLKYIMHINNYFLFENTLLNTDPN